ncbi:hypothetical protein ABZP36_033081 [Zizania latifolia]
MGDGARRKGGGAGAVSCRREGVGQRCGGRRRVEGREGAGLRRAKGRGQSRSVAPLRQGYGGGVAACGGEGGKAVSCGGEASREQSGAGLGATRGELQACSDQRLLAPPSESPTRRRAICSSPPLNPAPVLPDLLLAVTGGGSTPFGPVHPCPVPVPVSLPKPATLAERH